jgi:hypothetical protein
MGPMAEENLMFLSSTLALVDVTVTTNFAEEDLMSMLSRQDHI